MTTISVKSGQAVRIMVGYNTNPDGTSLPEGSVRQQPYKELNEAGIKRIEALLKKRRGQWEYAYAVLAGGSTLKLWYYHPSETINGQPQRLTKEVYSAALQATRAPAGYSLWIIPTTAQKARNGNGRGKSVTVQDLSQIKDHFNSTVLRIDVYQNREKLGSYDHSGYRAEKNSRATS